MVIASSLRVQRRPENNGFDESQFFKIRTSGNRRGFASPRAVRL
jgi:hypothetical protein